MIVEPKVRGFICTTAHPTGCAASVQEQIDFVQSQPKMQGAQRVLVIGASTGYGLASRIAGAFSCNAATIGVIFERAASGKRTASAGWYNTAAFERAAQAKGLYAKTINGDAFSAQVKQQTIELIRQGLKTVDLVVYSLASPRRTMPDGTVVSSVLKTTGGDYTNTTIDLQNRTLSPVTLTPATPQEVEDTTKVMGGEDWMDWMIALKEAKVLAPECVTLAYSYIGPVVTHPMYYNGSIGAAKKHLFETSLRINQELGIPAYISVNKALVTQSSAAIPIVPLYISMLYHVMKEKGLHEGCIEQIYRLYHDKLFVDAPVLDEQGMLRPDDLEMREDVQGAIAEVWDSLTDENIEQYADIDGYWEDFYKMFGFGHANVDYAADVDVEVCIPSIAE